MKRWDLRATRGYKTYFNGSKRILYHVDVIAIVLFYLAKWPIFSCVYRNIFLRLNSEQWKKKTPFSNCLAWEFNDFRINTITKLHIIINMYLCRTNGLELEIFDDKFPIHCHPWFLAVVHRTPIFICVSTQQMCKFIMPYLIFS